MTIDEMRDDMLKIAITKQELFMLIVLMNRTKKAGTFEYMAELEFFSAIHCKRIMGGLSEADLHFLEMTEGNKKFSEIR